MLAVSTRSRRRVERTEQALESRVRRAGRRSGRGAIMARAVSLLLGPVGALLSGMVAAGPAVAAVACPAPARPSGHICTESFATTGVEQRFVVPTGGTSLSALAVGATGGSTPPAPLATEPVLGAPGDAVTGLLTGFGGGQTLYVEVGGSGAGGSCAVGGCAGGFNGGGDGFAGGGGGGASDLRTCARAATTCNTLKSRLIVAAGGGGAGSSELCLFGGLTGGPGGPPGYPGGDGGQCPLAGGGGGGAGTSTGGGEGGTNGVALDNGQAGALGQGGGGAGGGGGGGLYGGGGGGHGTYSPADGYMPDGGGGGGANLIPSGGSSSFNIDPPQVDLSWDIYAIHPKAITVLGAPLPLVTLIFTFTDDDPNANTSQYGGYVSWGDGATSQIPAFVRVGQTITVTAVHTYTRAGDYSIYPYINDVEGASTNGYIRIAVT